MGGTIFVFGAKIGLKIAKTWYFAYSRPMGGLLPSAPHSPGCATVILYVLGYNSLWIYDVDFDT